MCNRISFLGFVYSFLILWLAVACAPEELTPNPDVLCELPASDSSATHPKATQYENLLQGAQQNLIPGLAMLVKDADGQWAGGAGWADMTDEIPVSPCMPFLIASISKVYTATVVMKLIDQGILALDQPVSQWIDEEKVSKIENADQATIRHLLDHTSGIADWITTLYELQQINSHTNDFSTEDLLAFAYGKPATHEVGATYAYSNTNFVLLGLIAEAATQKELATLYEEIIFAPLRITSGYYGTDVPIRSNLVRGYIDFVGDGKYVDAEWLYRDELKTGDGGIATNIYDMATFVEGLFKGQLVSDARLTEMTTTFELPEDWVGDFGNAEQYANGLGLEVFRSSHGIAYGHSGGIFGFSSLMLYFPAEDATFILLNNSISVADQKIDELTREALRIMFE